MAPAGPVDPGGSRLGRSRGHSRDPRHRQLRSLPWLPGGLLLRPCLPAPGNCLLQGSCIRPGGVVAGEDPAAAHSANTNPTEAERDSGRAGEGLDRAWCGDLTRSGQRLQASPQFRHDAGGSDEYSCSRKRWYAAPVPHRLHAVFQIVAQPHALERRVRERCDAARQRGPLGGDVRQPQRPTARPPRLGIGWRSSRLARGLCASAPRKLTPCAPRAARPPR